MSNVYQLPGAALEEPRPGPSLNLTEREIVDAAGGYVRPAEQLRELHARGFVRAYIPKVGRRHVVLERAHYDAVTRGQFGAPKTKDPRVEASYRFLEENQALRRWTKAKAKQDAREEEEKQRLVAASRARYEAELAEARPALVRYHAAKRRVAKLRRTPPWADLEAIRAVYDEADRITRATGIPHHVDHEIPLQGKLVSGLHVHNNLQVLTGSENSKKRNRFEIEG